MDLVHEDEREPQRRGSSVTHVTRTIQRAKALVGKAKRLGDLTPVWIRKSPDRVASEDTAPQTLNGYRLALSGFLNRLVREGRWRSNPVEQVAPVKVSGKTRDRRALTAEELGRLIRAAPPPRALVYRVAATTGLRRGELAALRWADLDRDAATLLVRASTSKNRSEATQPLPPGTVAALRATRGETQLPSAPIFDSVPTMPTVRKDLEAAGVPYQTEEGIADFHALRVTYCTMLARAGVSLVQARRLMRHSDPKLTANVYTRLRLDDGHEAVARIDPCGPLRRPAARKPSGRLNRPT